MKGPMPGSRTIEFLREPHLRRHTLRLAVDLRLNITKLSQIESAVYRHPPTARKLLLAAVPAAEPYLDVLSPEPVGVPGGDGSPSKADRVRRSVQFVREPHRRGRALRLTVEIDLSSAVYTRIVKFMAAGDHRAALNILARFYPSAKPDLDAFFAEWIHFQTLDENPPPHDPAFQARVEGLLAEMGVPTDAVC